MALREYLKQVDEQEDEDDYSGISDLQENALWKTVRVLGEDMADLVPGA